MKKKPLAYIILIAILALGSAACQKKAPVITEGPRVREINLERIHFDFDKYTLRADSRAILERHAYWLRQNPDVSIVIEGNTDEWGTEEYNMALGERRATAAKSYLVNLGVSPDRISVISYGESRPLDPEHNAAAWSKNRRDDFKGFNR